MGEKRRSELTEAISRAVRLSQTRTDAYDEAVCARVGINRTDHRCIDILSLEGRITAGRLGELAGLSSGATTTALDRLERAGLACRVRDEVDRRRIQIELTDEAHRVLWPYYEPLERLANELYARYSDAELELVLDFLQAGEALFEEKLRRLVELEAAPAPERPARARGSQPLGR